MPVEVEPFPGLAVDGDVAALGVDRLVALSTGGRGHFFPLSRQCRWDTRHSLRMGVTMLDVTVMVDPQLQVSVTVVWLVLMACCLFV